MNQVAEAISHIRAPPPLPQSTNLPVHQSPNLPPCTMFEPKKTFPMVPARPDPRGFHPMTRQRRTSRDRRARETHGQGEKTSGVLDLAKY
jgi:hypothetical protein